VSADVFVTCPGTPGHGSLMLPDTAGEKVEIIINKFMDLRRREKKKLESNTNLTVGDVTSVNLTQIKVSARSPILLRKTLTLTT
jgi:aminoacylase